jgi:hypothetical protein
MEEGMMLASKLALLTPAKRNRVKEKLLNRFREAERLKPNKARAELDRIEEKERRENEENGWRISVAEIKLRVRAIRTELEKCSEMMAGLNFDFFGPVQWSIDGRDDDLDTAALAEQLNPVINGRWKRVQSHLYETGEVSLADDDLGPMKWDLADAAFAIGVLAGAIFTEAPEREINRLERGLVHATIEHR